MKEAISVEAGMVPMRELFVTVVVISLLALVTYPMASSPDSVDAQGVFQPVFKNCRWTLEAVTDTDGNFLNGPLDQDPAPAFVQSTQVTVGCRVEVSNFVPGTNYCLATELEDPTWRIAPTQETGIFGHDDPEVCFPMIKEIEINLVGFARDTVKSTGDNEHPHDAIGLEHEIVPPTRSRTLQVAISITGNTPTVHRAFWYLSLHPKSQQVEADIKVRAEEASELELDVIKRARARLAAGYPLEAERILFEADTVRTAESRSFTETWGRLAFPLIGLLVGALLVMAVIGIKHLLKEEGQAGDKPPPPGGIPPAI